MPTYSYRCPKCGREYDKFQKISDTTLAKCPECGTQGERVITGGAGLVFKGSGFYITDYKRAGESKSKGEGQTKDQSPSKSKESAPAKDTSGGKKTGADS
jgi:putative FmdB family regulatory protein